MDHSKQGLGISRNKKKGYVPTRLLHFLEVNLFEQRPLISIFQPNARTSYEKGNFSISSGRYINGLGG